MQEKQISVLQGWNPSYLQLMLIYSKLPLNDSVPAGAPITANPQNQGGRLNDDRPFLLMSSFSDRFDLESSAENQYYTKCSNG